MEAFIGLVHVKDTSTLSLKKAIVDVVALTRDYCNHICMKQVCHKGRLGKR